MRETEEQRIERCKKLYGCEGDCYNLTDEQGNFVGMCGGIDTCPETRGMEFIATIVASLIVISVPIGAIAGLIWAVFHFLI
ncbi:MAG: hypothetical protein NC548_60740 [Lachnospiraceae bacterium]|nr:hypothetical protein [Lachnospiraceae bacterium]